MKRTATLKVAPAPPEPEISPIRRGQTSVVANRAPRGLYFGPRFNKQTTLEPSMFPPGRDGAITSAPGQREKQQEMLQVLKAGAFKEQDFLQKIRPNSLHRRSKIPLQLEPLLGTLTKSKDKPLLMLRQRSSSVLKDD